MFAKFGKCAMAFAVLALVAAPATAGTIINDPWNETSEKDEANFYEILNHYYGFSYTSSDQIEAAIVSPDIVFDNLAGSTLSAQAKYAGNNPQAMGIYDPDDTAALTELIEVSAGYPGGYADEGALSGTLTGVIPSEPSPFGFYLESTGGSSTYTWYSDPSLNAGVDHMIMLDLGVLDNSLVNTYLIGWEDMQKLDSDFNDLVVEFAVVPEPATMALLGLGIAGLAVRQARRKKQD